MSATSTPRRQAGFSLVELAVALVIAALVTAAVLPLLPLGNRVAEADRAQRELARVEEALLGHARVHAQLPAADSDGDGLANPGATSGWVPVRTLGLPPRLKVQYSVQANLLTPPGDLFHPHLSPDYSARVSTTPNGLDFCMRLLLDQRDGAPLGSLGMPAAYALGHAGGPGHDAVLTAAALQLPGSDAASQQPMPLAAAGLGELASRLSCPDRLARAQGASQAAMAAYSAKRMTDLNHLFRTFNYERITALSKSQAETALALSGINLALLLADEIIAITLAAAGWPPEGFAIALGIAEQVMFIASLPLAIIDVVDATKEVEEAEQGIRDAEEELALVTTQKTRTDALYRNASEHALRLDEAGLNP